MKATIGIMGGSGLYNIPGLQEVEWRHIGSTFGAPSDELCFGTLDETPLIFIPRHGRGHPIPPSNINYRANIHALKQHEVTDIISVSAVGSLNETLAPGTFVIADQFIDRTTKRESTFFGPGLVAHVSMANPVCPRLGDALEKAGKSAGIPVVRGGTYVVIEGPQFSTKAESHLYRQWGADVIGMTNMPEAKLAREAEMCYATVAMVTDYDCWHEDHDNVNVDMVLKVLKENGEKARALMQAVVPHLKDHAGLCAHGCQNALDYATVTAEEARDEEMIEKLWVIAGRVL